MPSTAVKEKIAKLTNLGLQADALLTETKTTGLSTDIDQKLTLIGEEMKRIRSEIETEQKLESHRADLANLNDYINAPVNRLPHGVNGDEHSERKTLEGAGWEFKSGLVHKMTSLGKSVPMYPMDVLFGDIPTQDADAANFYRTTRASMAPEYKAAFERLIKLTARAPQGAAYSMLTGLEQKALSEGTDTAGGFIVPPDIQAEMLVRVAQMAVMRANCRVQPTNRDVLRWPAVKANTSTYSGTSGGSIYASGFVGAWAGETPAFTDTDPSFQTLDIPIKKVRVATKLSNDFVMDAAVNVLAFMAQNGAENMALTEDQGLINGTGASLQPLGLLNSGISDVNISGTTAFTISNTIADLGSATKLITMAYALPAQYVSRAKWIMKRTIEGEIRGLVDGSGRYLWPPFTGSAFVGMNPTGYNTELLGFPVLHSDWMPADGTQNNQPLFLGDLSNYIIGQRTQVTSLILRERFLDTDQVGIILFERIGGGMFNTDSARVGQTQ